MKFLLILCLALIFSGSFAQADFMDKAKNTRSHSRKQPFASQQMSAPPIRKKAASNKYQPNSVRKMQAFQKPAETDSPQGSFSWSGIFKRDKSDDMRPGRENDNPAANRFGRAAPPNKYIYGSHKGRNSPLW